MDFSVKFLSFKAHPNLSVQAKPNSSVGDISPAGCQFAGPTLKTGVQGQIFWKEGKWPMSNWPVIIIHFLSL